MIDTIYIKKGYQPRLLGSVGTTVDQLHRPTHVAACPVDIPFIKPRLKVKVGDDIAIGSLLFEDKQEPRFRFLSPGGGRIEDIRFGPRRVIEQIVITLASDESHIPFPSVAEHDLATMARADLVEMLLKGGVWPFLRALPFRDIADPDRIPPVIFVTLDDSEPFLPAVNSYLADNEELFALGLKALKRLTKKVYVTAANKGNGNRPPTNAINLWYRGNYPAGDAGVLLYHIKKSSEENNSWYISGQDVLMMAHLLTTGTYPTDRVVAVGGSKAAKHHHLQTRVGAPIANLAAPISDFTDIRLVAGGVFKGRTVAPDGYLGLYDTSITLLPAGNKKEFMALFNPGWNKATYSRAYLSPLNRSKIAASCNRHGDERACVACMHCADVCPVDILPQLTYKAVLAEEVEETLEHGLLDCVECGLCTYVCPSKIELAKSLKSAKAAYRKERESQ